MASETALYYLRNYPQDAVRVLESFAGEDLTDFIDGLSDSDQAQLLSNLLPQTAAKYLADINPERAADLVEQLRSAVAAPILSTVSMTKRRPILDALSVEKRTTIRHLLRFPDDSIGSVMMTNTLACRADGNVRRAKQIIRRFNQVELPTMVVVDKSMKPVGILSVNKLLQARDRELVSEHMRFVPARFRAHAAISSVLTHPIWETEEHVPVIDADDRYVGLLAKASLHKYALAAPISAIESVDLSTTIFDLADLIWSPAAEALARVTTADSRTSNE